LTAAIHHRFGNSVLIDSLGWRETRIPSDWLNHHFEFDLNCAQTPDSWIQPTPHDIVVLAEVLEHLYTAPSLVLAFLVTFLDNDGILVLQTPNAVSLRKRAKIAIGRHPYEQIRAERANPGHFREYTATELVELLTGVGLAVELVEFASYWRASSRPGLNASVVHDLSVRKTLGSVCDLVEDAYGPFRQGLTLVARKP